jgi:hypothetical protein
LPRGLVFLDRQRDQDVQSVELRTGLVEGIFETEDVQGMQDAPEIG